VIDPDEANETYKTASAIAAFQLTQLAFATLVKKGILPKAEAEQILRQTIETIKTGCPWSAAPHRSACSATCSSGCGPTTWKSPTTASWSNRQETNIRSVKELGEIEKELCYDIPREIVGRAWGGKYRGQCQKWYALRFTGKDSEIDIAHPAGGHDPEFVEWRWERLANVVDLVVPFKRRVYEQVVKEFERFARDAS
jgi:hypothetical protein